MCRIELSSNREQPESQNQKDHAVKNSHPVNALNNPFIEEDTIVIPVDFEAVLLSPGVPKPLSLEEPATAEVTNTSPSRMTRYKNGDREVFMPTVAFRMQDGKEYEGEVTVELLKANNRNTHILVFV